MTSEYDVVIRDTQIVDGSGAKAFDGSIGVKGDRIVSVGEVRGDAKETIQGKGMVVSPGFIDAHSRARGGTYMIM